VYRPALTGSEKRREAAETAKAVEDTIVVDFRRIEAFESQGAG
jgi:hypothetical protein